MSRPSPFALLALLLSAGPALGAAGDRPAEPDAELPRSRFETVVSASLSRSTVLESPRAVSVVDREELKSRPPRSTPDALLDEEGVFVERTSHSSGAPFLRGLGGPYVVLLVDGIRINTTTTRTGPNDALMQVDPYIVDAIEVVRGPGSVLYGSDAIGGVIQVRTRRPLPIAGSDIELNAGLRGIFTSQDQSGQGSMSAGGRWGRYAVDTAFSIRRFGDLTGGSDAPYQPMTGYREGDLYVGGGADFSFGTLTAVYQGNRVFGAIRNDRSQPGDLRLQTEIDRDLAYVRYAGSFRPGRLPEPLQVQATLSYQRQRTLEDRLRMPLDRVDRDDNYVDMVGVQALGTTDAGRGGKLAVGAESYLEWVGSSALRGRISDGPGAVLAAAPEAARYPGGSSAQSVALYLQDDLDLLRVLGHPEHPGRLRALVALRGGGSFLSIGRDDRLVRQFPQLGAGAVQEARQEANPVYAATVHLRYEPWSWLAISGGFMSGYRAPNLADYARLGAEGLGYIVPSAGLRPERALSGEAGLRAAFRRLEGGVFYAFTLIDDVLAATPVQVAGQDCHLAADNTCLERYYGRQNADQARIHAVEGTARLYLPGGLSVFGTLSYTHGTLDRGATPRQPAHSEPFYKIPPLNGVAALQLRRPRSTFSFAEVSLRWAAPQDRLGQADLDDPRVCPPIRPAGVSCPGTPGFAVVSIRAAARLSRNIYVTGAVENLTNTSYRYHGSGIDGPGLGASLSLELTY